MNHQLTDEAKEILEAIKPHITGFSHSFQLEGKHGDEVICGGKVTKVVDMSIWGDMSANRLIYVTLDDALGELLIVVPGLLWNDVQAKVNDLVIASGVLFKLPKLTDFVTVAKTIKTITQEDEPLRLLVKKIRKLPRKNNTRDSEMEAYWREFEDVLLIEDESKDLVLTSKWLHFESGTDRETIWHWFDEQHSKGVGWLMNCLDNE